ncbi:hypothetical protein QFZ52_000882 [Arthrobacter woluwensis]|uniref:hypothetical protein n=1 Tax=Arthrobacter woluwensis TaxID=156980 RepID=UPI00278A7EF1|nr:hypothetical protein [Arthrobacter woluwensis]MDQ0708230.1 hypothetical protein [Arthrobacter woluwensis]
MAIPARHLLPGSTAFALLRLRFRCTTVAIIVLAIVWLVQASGMHRSWFTDLLAAIMFVSAMPVVALIGRVASRQRAERAAGYTTLWRGDPELEQRDPYLRTTLRPAGAPYLDRPAFTAALERCRAASQGAPDQ